jgi:hypothetical protein
MVIHVDVVIVGLCTLLNLHGAANFSDPSVVAPEYGYHGAFIAYRDGDVTSSAANPVNYNGYWSIPVVDESVSLGDDLQGTPTFPDTTFDDLVAHFSQFSDMSTFTYDTRFVPASGKEPDGSVVAMYVKLGGGSVTAQNPTKITWEFRNATDPTLKPHKPPAMQFARSVTYGYDLPQAATELTLSLKKLGSNTTRTVTFKPVSGNTITIYIGNSRSWYDDVIQYSPSLYGFPSHHFQAYYYFVTNSHIHYIPYPASGGNLGGTTDLGYCGPTGLP